MTTADIGALLERVPDERLAEMLAGLKDVTPGPWSVTEDATAVTNTEWRSYEATVADCEYESGKPWECIVADAAHIARCDPDTMRAILTELQALRALTALKEPTNGR